VPATLVEDLKWGLRRALNTAITCVVEAGELPQVSVPEIVLEIPSRKEHGDWATNVALVLASQAKKPPRQVAEMLVKALPEGVGFISRTEVAGPGFINFFLDKRWLHQVVRAIYDQGLDFGRTDRGAGERVQVEFVSANPVGPMTVVQARAGAIGDTLASLLNYAGYYCEREYYVNDAGQQVKTLGVSLEIRFRQVLGQDIELPEKCYPGEYVTDMARELLAEKGPGIIDLPEEERQAVFTEWGVARILRRQREELSRYGVNFDVWFSEKSLHESGAVVRAMEALKASGKTYEADGALWFRSTEFGDDKDRVMIKSDGDYTYLAPDAAYHLDKLQRGFTKLIDIWGPDHHGYIPRMKAIVQAFGYKEDTLEVLIAQLVRLVKGGEAVRMSKRGGTIILMDELIDEVGKDAARFFFLMRAPASQLDFDIDLAKLETSENPVFYVQYAHARISSILREAKERGYEPPETLQGVDIGRLTDESEYDLMKKMADLPEEIYDAAIAREPHRMTRYLMELATTFHGFYTRCRVLSDDRELSRARLALTLATRTSLQVVLKLIGITAPESM
jgi:arginyl-tRNA synthetase